jgi:hypothetical protein
MLTADVVLVAALMVMIGATVYFAPRVKERVAMQWGFDGKPTWHAPKLAAMWGPVAVLVIVRLLIYLAMTYTPDKVHGPEIGVLVLSIVAAGAHLFTLWKAVR